MVYGQPIMLIKGKMALRKNIKSCIVTNVDKK